MEKKKGLKEALNARVSVEAVRTLEHQPLVTAVPLRISEDCSHVRDRCTERVCSPVSIRLRVCVRGSRDFKISSANNYELVVLLLRLPLINTATRP